MPAMHSAVGAVGADVVGSARSYDTGLVVIFRDRAALDAYQTNPHHVTVAQHGVALCQHIVAVSPSPIGVTDADVPAEVVAKEREIAKAQAIESGKPPQIAEKMVEGKIRKFFEEHVLTKQLFIKDDKKRVSEILPKGVTIKSFVRFQMGA